MQRKPTYVALGTICTITKGATGIQKAVAGDYPLVTTGEERGSHNEYQFDAAAVCIPTISSTGHGHASLKRIHYQEGKFALGSILAACIPKNPQQLSARFLYVYLSINKDEILVPLMQGTANVSLTSKALATALIPLLSMNQQERIIRLYDQSTDAQKELVKDFTYQATLLTRLRQAILREAVQGRLLPQNPTDEPATELLTRIRAEKQRLVKEKKLRADKPLPPLSEAEVPYEVPQGWAWCRLGKVVSQMDSGWSPACLSIPASDGQWGVLKTTAVQEMEYRAFENKALPTSLKAKEQYEVEAGDILITRAGPYQRVGVVCLVETSPKKLMISDKIIRFHCLDGLLHPQYIALCTQTGSTRLFLDSKKSGMAESQVNISQDNLRLAPIPLPPLAEQRRIVAKVAELLAHCDGLEAELHRARQAAAALHAAALREAFAPAPVAVPA